MKTYTSQDTASYGVYISAVPPDVCFVGNEGETLEGRQNARYVHVPTPLVLVLSPLFGAAFVLLFPLFILVGVGMAVSAFVSDKVEGFASEHAYLVRVGWEPATAYLNKKNTKAAEGTVEKDAELQKLAAEVETRRNETTPKA
jgi:hypothetical protein